MTSVPARPHPIRTALALLAVVAGALAALGTAAAPAHAAPGLPAREVAELKQQIGEAAQQNAWPRVAELMTRLAEDGDKKTFAFLLKVAERAPARAGADDCAVALRRAAEVTGDDRRFTEELRKTATRSKQAAVRRALLIHLAARRDWPALIEGIKDDDEDTAAVAVWRLADARVVEAVEPMIAQMEKLDRTHGGIWDVLRNALAQLLGQKLGSGVEYRSRWQLVQQQGGLEAVKPEAEPPPSGGGSVTRLFGREIECTRVVFVLDVSGSMQAIDPNQRDYDDPGSRTRGGETEGERPKGKTRLERAQRELKKVIQALPEGVKINVVAYSSQVKLWRAGDGDAPPTVHAMSKANKDAACEFVDSFTADGVTVTDDALVRAFSVEGARCFYLLSDGAPTHDGTTIVPTEDILRVVADYSKDRKVTIHTLGFRGADRDMMQRLAEQTGGKYSDIE